jgi:hypothetical protein
MSRLLSTSLIIAEWTSPVKLFRSASNSTSSGSRLFDIIRFITSRMQRPPAPPALHPSREARQSNTRTIGAKTTLLTLPRRQNNVRKQKPTPLCVSKKCYFCYFCYFCWFHGELKIMARGRAGKQGDYNSGQTQRPSSSF